MKQQELSFSRLTIYGALTVPLAFAGLPVALYLSPFYAKDLGVSLTAIGLVLMLARASDVITDPLIGRWSDHTRTRWGRRKPWIAAGVPVMMLASIFLFLPTSLPDSLEELARGEKGVIWLLFSVMFFYLGWTMITIAYGAWGAELTEDYDERSRVSGAREIGATFGLMAAATAAAVSVYLFDYLSPDEASITGLAIIFLFLLPVFAGVLLFFLKEPPAETSHQISLREGLPILARNGPFRRLILALFLGALGNAMNAACVIFFYDHVLDMHGLTQKVLAVYLCFGILGAPFWIWLGKKISKHRAFGVATFCLAFVFIWVPTLGPGDEVIVFGVAMLSGLCLAATPLLTASMMADIIDLDELQTGEQRTGLFVAFYNMARKLADALGVGISLPLIAFFGFQANGENDEKALLALTIVYCLVPIILWLLAAWSVWRFPITRERHDEIRSEIEKTLIET